MGLEKWLEAMQDTFVPGKAVPVLGIVKRVTTWDEVGWVYGWKL